CRHSPYTRGTGTTHRIRKRIAFPSLLGDLCFLLVAALLFSANGASAQIRPPIQNQPPIQIPPPDAPQQGKTYTLKKTVDMVRLPVTIVDKKGNFVPELKEQ